MTFCQSQLSTEMCFVRSFRNRLTAVVMPMLWQPAARLGQFAGQNVGRVLSGAQHEAHRVQPLVEQALRSRSRQQRQEFQFTGDVSFRIVDILNLKNYCY